MQAYLKSRVYADKFRIKEELKTIIPQEVQLIYEMLWRVWGNIKGRIGNGLWENIFHLQSVIFYT